MQLNTNFMKPLFNAFEIAEFYKPNVSCPPNYYLIRNIEQSILQIKKNKISLLTFLLSNVEITEELATKYNLLWLDELKELYKLHDKARACLITEELIDYNLNLILPRYIWVHKKHKDSEFVVFANGSESLNLKTPS